MKNFSEETKDDIITLFAKHGIDTVIVEHLFPNSATREDQLCIFFEFYSFVNSRNICVSDDGKSGIIWYPPRDGFVIPPFIDLYKNHPYLMEFGVKAVSRLITYYSWSNGFKKKLITEEDYYYIVFIASYIKDSDNNPIRSSSLDELFLPMIEKARNDGINIYLDTFTESTIPFLGEYGFKLFHKSLLPGTELTKYYLKLDTKSITS